MNLTPEKTAVATVLAVAALTVVLSGITRLSIHLAAAESTASEALDAFGNIDGRLSDVESTIGDIDGRLSDSESKISDLSDTSEDHESRLDNVESQQLMRSW